MYDVKLVLSKDLTKFEIIIYYELHFHTVFIKLILIKNNQIYSFKQYFNKFNHSKKYRRLNQL